MTEVQTATSAAAPVMTETGQQQPGRGRSGRGRGGRRRGAAQGQERRQQNPQAANLTDTQSPSVSQPSDAVAQDAGAPSSSNRGGGRGRRGARNPRRGGGGEPRRGGGVGEPRQRAAHGGRRTFGGHLTSDAASNNNSGSPAALSVEAPEFVPGQQPPVTRNGAPGGAIAQAGRSAAPKKEMLPKSTATDLPTRIHEDINNGHYECVICTNEVLRNSRVWSCSICWTVAHLSCVRKWYSNQNKKANEQEGETPNGWRCPGCNSSLTEEPTSYHCWCGKESNPHSIPGLPPHSCNQTCAKPRPTCPHPCGLVCHAGPCPPCGMMGPSMSCYCGKNTSTKRCTETSYANGWSCAEICGDLLPCGEHECSQPCHSGLCGSCEIPIPSFCYCGKEHKDIACEQRGDKFDSYDYGQLGDDAHTSDVVTDGWYEGTFDCEAVCGRPFDCGNHDCQQACHAQDQEPAHCPFSPDAVSHCPCGKTQLADILDQPRQNCKDPIPTCGEICDKPLECGHRCLSGCHGSSCPPCSQAMDITCRCGRTTTRTVCHQGNLYVPECMRVCRAQLSCGRHNHDLHCCPGEKKAVERVAARRKRKNGGASNDEVEAEHICVRVCGRNLKCGKHACAQMCHPGPCPTCPEAVFEEISCNCGRTVLYPPQPCGTQPPECRYECTRSSPACGHPRVSHTCHTDDKPCPPCPFLVEKRCICGKQTLKNQPCWFEEPRCGLPCGNKLKCGTHLCTKPCHRPGECEDANIRGSHCQQPCLKVKKACDHADTDPCHAPYPCKEEKPCQAKTFITCECQHRKQEVRCMASKGNPFPDRPPLKCDDECLRLQRNAKLAAALNIDPETHKDSHVPYSDKTLELFKEGVRWAQTQEREFRVFASDAQEKRLRFKPMKSQQRAFLHALAEDYGFDSESQDPEPHRHVSIFKTPRFVSAPAKTLAQCVQIKTSNATEDAASAGPVTNPLMNVPYNALLLTVPRFGLTVEEVEAAIAKDLATQPTVTFTTGFLPNDEIVIKGSGTWAAQALETAVIALKPLVSQTITRTDIAKAVFLCHADTSLNVLRREVDPVKNADGWNSVVGRSSARQARSAAASSSEAKPAAGRKLLMLKKEPKKKVEVEPVEDDWEAAAEKITDETED